MDAEGIRDILEGKQPLAVPVPKPKFTQRSEAELAQYLGEFEREGGSRVGMIVRDGILFAGDVKLSPTGPDCFFEYKYYGDVCFVRDSSRRIIHLTWASPGFTSTWVKK